MKLTQRLRSRRTHRLDPSSLIVIGSTSRNTHQIRSSNLHQNLASSSTLPLVHLLRAITVRRPSQERPGKTHARSIGELVKPSMREEAVFDIKLDHCELGKTIQLADTFSRDHTDILSLDASSSHFGKQDYNRPISRLSIQTQMATIEDKLELAVHSLKINQLAETLGSGECILGKAIKRRYINESFITFISSLKLTEDEITSTVETGKEDEDECKRESGPDIILAQVYVDDIIFGSTDAGLSKEFADDDVFSSNDSNVYLYPLDRNARKEHTYMDHQGLMVNSCSRLKRFTLSNTTVNVLDLYQSEIQVQSLMSMMCFTITVIH
ncbi:hypothetical protein LXL04_024194 [Taraxacum kok-saghyz]